MEDKERDGKKKLENKNLYLKEGEIINNKEKEKQIEKMNVKYEFDEKPEELKEKETEYKRNLEEIVDKFRNYIFVFCNKFLN